MTRVYRQTQRAARQEETRRRIVEATVELHQSTGPARTTISAIAELAGVQRLTVYKHFPDERSLFSACTAHYQEQHPAPDLTPWMDISDPERRLRTALGEIYAYYRTTEPMIAHSMRDMPLKPVLYEILAPLFEYWQRVREVLSEGWEVHDAQRQIVHAGVGLALDFGTWGTLVREQGLADDQAIEFMVRAVLCAAAER